MSNAQEVETLRSTLNSLCEQLKNAADPVQAYGHLVMTQAKLGVSQYILGHLAPSFTYPQSIQLRHEYIDAEYEADITLQNVIFNALRAFEGTSKRLKEFKPDGQALYVNLKQVTHHLKKVTREAADGSKLRVNKVQTRAAKAKVPHEIFPVSPPF